MLQERPEVPYSHNALSWRVAGREEGGKQSIRKGEMHTVIRMDALLTVSEQQLLNAGGT